jgi:cellulose synthase/poly-beta-1,6-N-acetylglucosamine synthase-like glycosyltransferase
MLSLREKTRVSNHRKTRKVQTTQTTQKNSKYVVAIPTYNRSEIIAKKTLETLNRGGVPAKCIYIFVANDAERDAYANVVPSTLFKKIVVGVKGITDQRKFIVKYFAEGTRVVSMDDDVEKFLRLSRNGEKLVDFKKGDLDRFIKKAFDNAEAHNLFLWGIYPMRYAYYMKHNVTTDLRLILGTAYGFICRHDADLVPTVGEKEDYENTIRHFLKDGGVMRFNNICLKTIYHSPGGLGKLTEERLQANKIAAEHLQQKYPDLVTIFKRPNGMTEVRLL